MLGLGQVIAGPLVDNYGRKPVALAGIILYMIGAAMAALATSPTVFIASRLLQGVAVCCTAVVAFSGVRDRLNGDDAARAFGFLNGTLNIIPALAPLLGGLLAEAFGWRAPFWFLVGYALLVLVLIALRLPETRPADTVPVKGLPVRQYARILSERRFLSFAVVNRGDGHGADLRFSGTERVDGYRRPDPLQFSLVFGANGFWIMLVSFFANRIIQGRPPGLSGDRRHVDGVGLSGLLLGVMLLPATAQAHWLAYMLPVASACAGLAFVMGPATSYALEPYSNEAGVASALVGFVQMAGGAALGLVAMALPLQPKLSLALVMLAGCLLALHARRLSKQIKGQIRKVA